MATVKELSDPKSNYLFKPLLHGVDFEVCRICFDPIVAGQGFSYCRRCLLHLRSGLLLADLVVPIAMAIKVRVPEVLSQYPYELGAYKDSTNTAAPELRLGFAAILWRWLSIHEPCLLGAMGPVNARDTPIGPLFEIVTSVPSTNQRAGQHPLEAMLKEVIGITSSRYVSTLATSPNISQGRDIDSGMFQLSCSQNVITGKTILLVDDTWTTGSNAQSAAHCLKSAGAAKVVVIVLGRWLRPSMDVRFQQMNSAYIKQIAQTKWDWSSCVIQA